MRRALASYPCLRSPNGDSVPTFMLHHYHSFSSSRLFFSFFFFFFVCCCRQSGETVHSSGLGRSASPSVFTCSCRRGGSPNPFWGKRAHPLLAGVRARQARREKELKLAQLPSCRNMRLRERVFHMQAQMSFPLSTLSAAATGRISAQNRKAKCGGRLHF